MDNCDEYLCKTCKEGGYCGCIKCDGKHNKENCKDYEKDNESDDEI